MFDNRFGTFKILLSWHLPRKTVFLDNRPLCPQCPAPSKTQNLHGRLHQNAVFFQDFEGLTKVLGKPHFNKAQKMHINFLNLNFLPPTQKPSHWDTRKSLRASFPGKERKERDARKLCQGDFGVKGGPKRAILGHKEFS